MLALLTGFTTNAGVVLNLTNAATDTDLPPQTLAFSLLAGPTNATLNSSSGVLNWRPLVSQADTTNAIIVRVADNGIPVMSATNSYSIKINPLAQPNLTSISVTAGQATLVANGDIGPDYRLLGSTNMVDWQTLLTTNPVTMPLLLSLPDSAEPQRYFRLQLGP